MVALISRPDKHAEPLKIYFKSLVKFSTSVANRPRARYFVNHNFLKAKCVRSILQHESPLAVGALRYNSLL